MIVDDIRNLEMYPQFGSCLEAIRAFIEPDRKETAAGRKVSARSDRTGCLPWCRPVRQSRSPTAEWNPMHLYADLQFIAEGRGVSFTTILTENLVPDGKPPAEGDILFYDRKGEEPRRQSAAVPECSAITRPGDAPYALHRGGRRPERKRPENCFQD
jgi:hypothetical protein